MKTTSWLWPDHTITKRESRQLREEHNRVVNEHAEMAEALRAIMDWHDGPASNPPKDLWKNARSLLARLEGGEK